jgi:hypothetical protein
MTDCLRLISNWSEPSVDDVLWRNLFHTRGGPRQQAALSLAERHTGDLTWLDRLLQLASRPQSAEACAAAIISLAAGWSTAKPVHQIIEAARKSDEFTILLAGVQAAIGMGQQSDDDLQRLLSRSSENRHEKEGLGGILVAGWSRSPKLKEFLLAQGLGSGLFEGDMTWVAIEAFPQDDAIAEALISGGVFENKLYSLHHLGDSLAKNFKRHPLIVGIIEKHIDERHQDGFALAKAARIAPTPLLKRLLLETFQEGTHLKFWQAQALVEEWGVDDAEVVNAMNTAFAWSLAAQAEIAHHMPRFILDRELCRSRLLEILRLSLTNERVRTDFVLEGLVSLGVENDPEALELALKTDVFSERFLASNTSVRLLQAFPKAPEVVSLALSNLRSREGLISVVALCQGHDPNVRQGVLDVAAPLQEQLRYQMVELLADYAVEDEAILYLLQEGGQEQDSTVVGSSLVAEARVRKERDEVDEFFCARLTRELSATGPYMDSRRLAGLAALLVVGREELVATTFSSQEATIAGWRFAWFPSVDTNLLAIIAEHWAALESVFGRETVRKKLCLENDAFVPLFLPHVDRSPQLLAHMTDIISQLDGRHSITSEVLRFAVRMSPNAPRTLDLCLAALHRGRAWGDFIVEMTAAELIGKEFLDSNYAYGKIIDSLSNGNVEGPLAALCEGWPESEELDKIFKQLKAQVPPNQLHLSTPVAFKIIAAKSDTHIVAERLSEAANGLTGDLWDGFPFWIPNIIKRIQKDDTLVTLMIAKLRGTPTSGEKVSFAALLAAARGVSGEVEAWCISELERATADPIPEAGLDVTLGKHCLVPQRLRELIRLRDA